PRQLLRSDYRVEYHDGLLLHVRDGVLLASRADLDRAEMIGSPTVIVPALAADLSTWHGQFSASATGVLVFNRMTSTSDASAPVGYSWAVEGDRVSAFNYSGRLTTTHGTGLPILSMALSPDGFTLALSVVSEQGTPDIVLHPTAWVFDRDDPEVLDQQALAVLAPDVTRLTFLDDAEVAPVWSPGSDEVAFRWDGDADRPRGIYRKRLGGGSEVLVRDNKGEDDWPDDWTSDGKYLLIVKGSLITSEKNDLWAVSLEDGSEFPVVETPDPDRDPRVSPDGRWLAYTQRESGRSSVYVVPFPPGWPEGGDLDRKWRVSDAGGRMPRWSRDGDELFYITDAGNLAAVDVDTEADPFSFGSPRELFPTPWDTGRRYDVTPDDKQGRAHFMFLDSVEASDAPIAVILNWQRLLGEQAKR
ncbi:MAG: TolB family protein, partial [Planctomycetota bacterium]